MDLRSKRNKVNATFSMSSLTDIIFLLLIFFLVTSSLVMPNSKNLFLPNSSDKTETSPNISVSITKDLVYSVNGKDIAFEGLSQELLQAAEGSKEEPIIVLYTDKTVPIQNVIQVMDVADQLAYQMVIATEPEE